MQSGKICSTNEKSEQMDFVVAIDIIFRLDRVCNLL